MDKIHPLYLHKNEDAQQYKKFAEEGMDLMYPVRVNGVANRPDIGIPYHATIKLFDTSKDTAEDAHEVAKNLSLNPPDPEKVKIKTITLKGRTGYTIHAIQLDGPIVRDMKEQHVKFSHMGFQESYEFHPHISVDKELWDHVVANEFATAKDAGIEFGPAELHHKARVVASYKPKVAQPFGGDKVDEDKLHASEKILTPAIIKDTIRINLDLQKHVKAVSLTDEYLANYLQDNPGLHDTIMAKHDKRLKSHFGSDLKLINIAWEKGIKEAYEARGKK